uniref:Brain tumor protein n=1 Tax=Panagrolaimus sp. ES5 TaxID=591445 RepID=A0AC34GLS5_9BILA
MWDTRSTAPAPHTPSPSFQMTNVESPNDEEKEEFEPMDITIQPPPPTTFHHSTLFRFPMGYTSKLGGFGVANGQFTEPSGIVVTAEGDIVVADTNNHRIQIFDPDCNFKFAFGEPGKRDGQLLYPNR